MSGMVGAVIAALEADLVALEQPRSLVRAELERQPTTPAPPYTVQSLAVVLGRTPRWGRGAIERGEPRLSATGADFSLAPRPRVGGRARRTRLRTLVLGGDPHPLRACGRGSGCISLRIGPHTAGCGRLRPTATLRELSEARRERHPDPPAQCS